jgi:hypothetical protein
MSNHRIHFAGYGDAMQARCSCKKRSPVGSRSDCEMWQAGHQHEVQRIRTHLASRTISLPKQHAWFVERVEDPHTPEDDRELWRQLAEETGAYMARKSNLLEQDPLF